MRFGTGIFYAAERSDNCGGEMKIISFIEEDAVIRKILKHCGLPACRSPRRGESHKAIFFKFGKKVRKVLYYLPKVFDSYSAEGGKQMEIWAPAFAAAASRLKAL